MKSTHRNKNTVHPNHAAYNAQQEVAQALNFEEYAHVLQFSAAAQQYKDWLAQEISQRQNPEELFIGKIISQDRRFPLVAYCKGFTRAQTAVALAKHTSDRAVIGDWVLIRILKDHEHAIIESIAPRRGVLQRWDQGSRGRAQILATHVDTVALCIPVGKSQLDTKRIIHALILCFENELEPIVVLTKLDRLKTPHELDHYRDELRELCGQLNLSIRAVSSYTGEGIAEFKELLSMRCTCFLGISGAGKSTLINTLLGSDVLVTSEVSSRKDFGRHTTVARTLHVLPDINALCIDAPGLRSFPLMSTGKGIQDFFPEIFAAAQYCKFSNCTHQSEPSCAVKHAVEAGDISTVRYENYLYVTQELQRAINKLDKDIKYNV